MTSQNLIAVITPSYNGINFVDQVITTVRNQNLPNVRHYIYDDASKDGTSEQLKTYANDSQVYVIFGDSNQGQSWGRNALIKQALADGCQYIAFLDVDDQWDPNHLTTSLTALEDKDIVYSLPKFILENGQIGVPYNIPIPDMFIGKHLSYNNFIWISSVVAKAKCFTDVEFDSRLDSVEDWDMWIQQRNLGHSFVSKAESSMTYLSRSGGAAGQSQSKMELFNQKNPRLPSLKLNIASGKDYREGYINADLYSENTDKVDAEFDAMKIPYPDNTVDEILALHVIEHFDFFEGQRVLAEWYRVLKPGGKLVLETPDFLENCKEFVNSDENKRVELYNNFFAHAWFPGGGHKFLFTHSQLATQLHWAKFREHRRIYPISKYPTPTSGHLFLAMEAIK
jgi:glycosyltransferase involved in cell wall biosynthesis